MARISQDTITNIKNKIYLSDYISRYATVKHKNGSDYVCCCPFHQEDTPSMYIHDDKQFFHCFGCGVGGDIFKFVTLMDNLSYYEAIKKIAEEVGVPLGIETEQDKHRGVLSSQLYSLYDRSRTFMNSYLLKTPQASDARKYLTDRHVSLEMIEKFSLGYLPSQNEYFYKRIKSTKEFSEELLQESGLFFNQNNNYSNSSGNLGSLFANRLVFPVRTWDNKTIAFSGRDLSGFSKAKYRNSPETIIYSKKRNLFGIYESLPALKETKSAIICEGNFDVVALHQAGVTNALAPLGTAFTSEQVRLLSRYCEKVSVLFDNDEAGVKATIKSLILLQENGLQNFVINLSICNDPSELLQEKGEKELKKQSSYEVSGFDYLVNYATSLYDIQNPKGKDDIFSFLKPYLDVTQSEIEKDSLLQSLSNLLDVGFKSVETQYYKDYRVPSNKKTQIKQIDIKPLTQGRLNIDLTLLLLIVNNRDLYPILRKQVLIEDLEDEEAISLYNILEDYSRSSDDMCGDDYFLLLIHNPQLVADVSFSYLMDDFKQGNCQNMINELVIRIRIRTLEKEKEKCEKLFKLTLSSGNDDNIKQLMKEKMELDKNVALLRQSLGEGN
ncbi:MAG: DNA primase [Spirochaetaceae bacterium]|nr:DNA primase [Spirochaetaceae bacterium]